MRMLKKTLGIVTLIVWSLMAGDVSAQDYAIKLMAPFKAGQKYQLRSKVTYYGKQVITSEGKVLKQNEKSTVVEGTADVEVVSVNEKGRPTALILTLKKLTQTAEKTSPLLPANTVVQMGLKAGKVYFQVNNNDVSPEVDKALVDLLGTPDPAAPNYDDIFGTAQPKKVGDEWKMNLSLALKQFEGANLKVSPDQVTGTMKLAGVTATRGTPCLRLIGKITVADFKLPLQLPAEMAIKKSTMEMNLTELVPVDGQSGPLQIILDNAGELTATGLTTEGRPLQLTVTNGQKVEQSYTY